MNLRLALEYPSLFIAMALSTKNKNSNMSLMTPMVSIMNFPSLSDEFKISNVKVVSVASSLAENIRTLNCLIILSSMNHSLYQIPHLWFCLYTKIYPDFVFEGAFWIYIKLL